MRPRQNLRDFQHNTPSSYQHLNHNPNLVQQQPQQSMAPPPPLQPSTVGAAATARQPLPTPDLFSELIKLGLNPEDMTKQSNRPREREEMFKNLQAILGKREVAELLQKLPPLNDWPITPPEFSRGVSGGNTSGICSRDSVICGPSGIVGSGGSATGAASFSNNNITNNGNSSQQEQDTQFASAQHQATASAINHHQHFRIPTTNTTTVHNSPQQQQHKPVLSIHQQQHQHDPTNRRLNHQHNLSTTPSSFANLNDMNRAPSSSSSSSSSSTNSAILDSHNSNIYKHKTSPPASYTVTSVGSVQRIPNIMDTLGGSLGGGISGPGFDNMYDNPAFQQQSNLPCRDNLATQQSIIRHQQLQRLLRANAGAAKNASPSTLRNDLQNSQRNSINNYTNNMSQMQRQLTSPNTSSAISPPQPTVPKSLLNLAACSSSPPATNNISSLTSAHRISRNMNTNQQASYTNNSGNISLSNSRALPRGNTNTGTNNVVNSRVTGGVDSSNLLQQMMTRSSQGKTSNSGHINRSNTTNQTLTSLLSDDQKNPRNACNSANSQLISGHSRASSQPAQRRQTQNLCDDASTVQSDKKAKCQEAYLAYIQERAAKAGIIIGEIKKPSSRLDPNPMNIPHQDETLVNSSNQTVRNESDGTCNKKEIESALSQVEARNDLSLLYPPISLAHNSQKHVNAISAGLVLSNDQDLFTDEVKMIVQEECNIIYECKGCSNLFRSLANLVKHKRTYCNDANKESASLELNRRVNILNSTIDLSVTKTTQSSEPNNNYAELDKRVRDETADDQRRQQQPIDATVPNQNYNLRGKQIDMSSVCGDIGSPRMASNQDKRDQSLLVMQETGNNSNISDSNTYGSPTKQTNLSRLLQSQPKNRPLGIKDSALMDALNMLPSIQAGSKLSVNSSKNNSCPINELNEQLVRNSSLAKTLLNEKARTIGSSQSLLELSGAEVSISSKPKRKLLEDCIQKVKRDKLVPSEDQNPSTSNYKPSRSDFDLAGNSGSLGVVDDNEDHPMDDLGHFKDPLAIDDSGTDSDALVMDFDESFTPTRRKSSQDSKSSARSRTRSSTGATSSSNSKLNSSSALLKALTRPVETRSAFMPDQRSNDDKAPTEIVIPEPQKTPPSAIVLDSDGTSQMSTSDHKNNIENRNDRVGCDNTSSQEQELPPPSPLFDKYTCEICEIDLENQSLLLSHVLETHKNEKKIYPCIFCSFSFITLENVCRHIIDMHKKTKTQVGRLKDVVLSRSFISSDFATCSDHPPVPTTSQALVENDVNIKSVSPAKSVTRRNSSALSDTTTAQQILEDTLAMVSDASSPNVSTTASSQRLASIMSRARLAERRVSSSNTGNNDNSQSTFEPDDHLSDSIITNITDEHLAILERQEAEIEAERLRREQAADLPLKDGGPPEIKSSQLSYVTGTQGQEVDPNVESFKDRDVDLMTVDCNDVETSAEIEQNLAGYNSTDQDDNSTGDDGSDNWMNGDKSGRIHKVRETRVLNDSAPEVIEYGRSGVSIQDENDNEANLELRQHQKNSSKGKHIADQLFEDNRRISDQRDGCDDEQNLDELYVEGPVATDPDMRESQEAGTESQGSSSSASDNSDDSDGDSDSSDSTSTLSSSSSSSSSSCSSTTTSSSSSRSSSNDDGALDDDLEEQAEANEEKGVEDEDELGWPRAHEVSFKEDGIKSRASQCASGSFKVDTDLISSQTSDKSTSHQDYNETGPSRHSSRAISKSATVDNCKLKVKSALRDVCGSGGSSASTASSSGPANAGAGSSGTGSGGIMKLKIQLKTQPDEKRSKVYRIVE